MKKRQRVVRTAINAFTIGIFFVLLSCDSQAQNERNNGVQRDKAENTAITDELQLHARRFEDTINVNQFGVVGDGRTDATAAINRAIAEASKRNAVLLFPKGVYIVSGKGVVFKNSNVAIVGRDAKNTVFCPGDKAMKVLFSNSGAVDIENILLSNITLRCEYKGNNADVAVRFRKQVTKNISIIGVYFRDLSHQYIQLHKVENVTIAGCDFFNGGEIEKGYFIRLIGGKNIDIVNNSLRGFYQGIYASPGRNHKSARIVGLTIKNNHIDGMWYLEKENKKGGGVGVTYSKKGLKDINVNFSTFTKDYKKKDITRWRLVRVLVPRANGNGKSTSGKFTDPNAHFLNDEIIRGEIIEVGAKRGIISEVISNSELQIEFWYNKETMEIVSAPQNLSRYQIWGIFLSSRTQGFDNHKVSVNFWHNLNGINMPPPDGARYELIRQLPRYGLHVGGRSTADLIIEGNQLFRNYGDQIGLSCGDAMIKNNIIKDGMGMGIAVENNNSPGSTIIDNTIIRSGSAAIFIEGDNNVVSNNNILGPMPAVRNLDLDRWGAIALMGGTGNKIKQNSINLKQTVIKGSGIVIKSDVQGKNMVEENSINNHIEGKTHELKKIQIFHKNSPKQSAKKR